jgi:tetratricopeptide (TPR) repeat protein
MHTPKKNNSPTATVKTPIIPKEHKRWKSIFYLTLLVFTAIMLSTGYGTGYHSDEMDMNAYGKANWKYLSSLGKDSTYKHIQLESGTAVPDVIKTYGGFFEVINMAVQKLAGPFFGGEYNTRHLICQLMGMVTLLFAGWISLLITRRYLYALLTIILLFLSPTFFGHILFNTKDIPFAMGYTIFLYGLLLFLKENKVFHWQTFAYIAIGITACIGTRAGGIILLPYTGLILAVKVFDKNTNMKLLNQQVLFLCISIAVGFAMAILPWPFVLESPVANFQYALKVATRFPQRIPFNFEGVFMDSLTIPSHYLPKWMSITIPVFIIMLFILSIITLLLRLKQRESRYYGFLLFAALAPVVYAIYSNSALYSAWRHLLFIYPPLVVFSVYILYSITRTNTKQYMPYILGAVCITAMIHPIYWSVKNHPYEYVYFNETSGGFAANYQDYETDYWQLAIKEATDWLYKHEPVNKNKGYKLASNAFDVCKSIVKTSYGDTHTQVLQSSYKAKSIVDWNYLILSNLFLDPYIIANDFYPPPNTIHTIEIDGKTICAIVKDTVREDFQSLQAMVKGDYHAADSLADAYLSKDPYCVKMLEISASAKASTLNWEACLQRCVTGFHYEPDNIVLHYYIGWYFAHKGEYEKALKNIEGAVELGYPKSKEVYQKLAELYALTGNKKLADYYDGFLK